MALKKINIFCIIFLLFYLIKTSAEAQPFTITAEANPNKITLSETLRYIVKVTGTTQALPNPQLPEFQDFIVLQYLPLSHQIFQSGTTIEISKTTGAVLKPTRVGTFTIPPPTVVFNNKTYQGNSVTVEIVKESVDVLPRELAELNIISATTDNAQVNKWLNGRLFILARAIPAEVYIGQPLTLSYYIYSDGVEITAPRLIMPEPQLTDFLKYPLKEPNELKLVRQAVGERLYNVALIRSLALIPTKTGTFSLEPLRMNCRVALPDFLRQQSPRRRGFFDDSPWDSFFDDSFFFSPFDRNLISAVMSSQPVEIKVLPVPEPVPANYSGTVGNYSLTAQVDRQTANEDELITLKIKFTGSGYVESVAEPKLPSLPDFDVFSSRSKSNVMVVGENLGGEKEFEYVLRPKRPGNIFIPPIEYVLFNPESRSFQTLTTNKISLEIAAVKKEQPLFVAAGGKKDNLGARSGDTENTSIMTIGKDINYIHEDGFKAIKGSGYIFNNSIILTLQLLPALFVVIAVLYRQRQLQLAADRGLARRRYARDVAGKRLRQAKNAIKHANTDLFFAEISRALRGFIADKLNKPDASLTVDEAINELCLHSIPFEYCQQIRKILDLCDTARYSPIKPSVSEMQQLCSETAQLIYALEKLL